MKYIGMKADIENKEQVSKDKIVDMLMKDLVRAEERADKEGWIEADDLEKYILSN